MPVIVPKGLPAIEELKKEGINVLTESQNVEGVKPLRALLVNLMPIMQDTERHFIRFLSNSPLEVELTLVRMASHKSSYKNTSKEHIDAHYKTHADIKEEPFDLMIVTGSRWERLPFEEMNYWQELTEMMDWAKQRDIMGWYVCWGAQAALYHRYGIPKHLQNNEEKKLIGVFEHDVLDSTDPLMHGLNDRTYGPHARFMDLKKEDIQKAPEVTILAESPKAGIFIVKFGEDYGITGHLEYELQTLVKEYERDADLGEKIDFPENLYENNDRAQKPIIRWREPQTIVGNNLIKILQERRLRRFQEKRSLR